MSAGGTKAGSLFSSEGLVLLGIETVAMPLAEVWYRWSPDRKHASVAIQMSGDFPVDFSLNSGDYWTIKGGASLTLDAQLTGQNLFFRHHKDTAQSVQIIKLV